jgi:ABC-type multidrug transport system fused ATPase/permease subunit
MQNNHKWNDYLSIYFARLFNKRLEDWEKVWPQLKDPKELRTVLFSLIKGRRHIIIQAFILEAFISGATATAMLALKKFLEPLEVQGWKNGLWMLIAFIGLNFFQLAAEFIKNIRITTLSADLLCELRGRLFCNLLYFPLNFYHKLESGSIINHVNRDVGLVVELVTSFIIKFVGTIFAVLSIGAVIFWLNWRIGVFICFFMLCCIPLVQIARMLVGRYAKRLFSLHSQLLSILQQSLYAIKYLKAMGFEKQESQRINKILEENRQLNIKVAIVHRILGPAMEFFYLIFICIGLIIAIYYFKNDMKLSLIAPLIYAMLRISKPVSQFINSLLSLEENIQAAKRLFGSFRIKQNSKLHDFGITLNEPISTLNLDKISYAYDDKKVILNNVNLKLNRGEIVALMGESGIGKSTLCELIMGLHSTYQGQILINGYEFKKLNMSNYRYLLGYVSQEPLLIRGTIKDNLLYGFNGSFSQEDLINSLEQANAWEFVSKLDKGVDSELGERGINLSGGECQRICLARALLRRPQILILDEATSSLDLDNEAMILKALIKLKEKMLILTVSHRYSIIKFVDKIIILKDEGGREFSKTEFLNNSINPLSERKWL